MLYFSAICIFCSLHIILKRASVFILSAPISRNIILPYTTFQLTNFIITKPLLGLLLAFSVYKLFSILWCVLFSRRDLDKLFYNSVLFFLLSENHRADVVP